MRPVWEKTVDSGNFLLVGSDYTRASGWIQSAQKGFIHLPTTGWQIGESSAGTYDRVDDPNITLTF